MTVLTIRADDRVFRRETWYGPGRDRLFADVEVEKAADLPPAIEFCALLFKPSDAEHLPQKLKGVITVYNGVHFFSIEVMGYQPSVFSSERTLSEAEC
jgi:hypothetical protein